MTLAAAAELQASKWQQLNQRPSGATIPEFTPSARARIGARLLAHFEARALRPVLAALTVLALFGVGRGPSLFTGREALRGALRMVLIGASAGAASFLLGTALGVAVG